MECETGENNDGKAKNRNQREEETRKNEGKIEKGQIGSVGKGAENWNLKPTWPHFTVPYAR